MKTIQVIIIVILTVSALADEKWKVDWSQVKARQDDPGFWEGRLFNPKMIKSNVNGRIVNGWETEGAGEHPYQAGLLMRSGPSLFLCGGCIIRANFILTAAHCAEGITETQVIAGAHILMNAEDSQQIINVSGDRHISHEAYNRQTLTNDICLLVLPSSFKYNQYIKPIALPRSQKLRQKSFVGRSATVSGWGRPSDNSWSISEILRAVDNYIITNEECANVYGTNIVRDSTICMQNGGRGTCHGDSGGPLTTWLSEEDDFEQESDQVLIGIVSFGAAMSCSSNLPDGYARVPYFMDWIDDNVARFS